MCCVTAQRYVYICRPHMTKQWCTVKTSTVGIILAFVLALAHVVSRAVDRNYSIWEIGNDIKLQNHNKILMF